MYSSNNNNQNGANDDQGGGGDDAVSSQTDDGGSTAYYQQNDDYYAYAATDDASNNDDAASAATDDANSSNNHEVNTDDTVYYNYKQHDDDFYSLNDDSRRGLRTLQGGIVVPLDSGRSLTARETRKVSVEEGYRIRYHRFRILPYFHPHLPPTRNTRPIFRRKCRSSDVSSRTFPTATIHTCHGICASDFTNTACGAIPNVRPSIPSGSTNGAARTYSCW